MNTSKMTSTSEKLHLVLLKVQLRYKNRLYSDRCFIQDVVTQIQMHSWTESMALQGRWTSITPPCSTAGEPLQSSQWFYRDPDCSTWVHTTLSRNCFDWTCASNTPQTSWFSSSYLHVFQPVTIDFFCFVFPGNSLCGPTRSPSVLWSNGGSRRRLLTRLNWGQLGKKTQDAGGRFLPPCRLTGLHGGTNICPWSPLSLSPLGEILWQCREDCNFRRNDREDEEESVFPRRPGWPVVRRWTHRAITIRRVNISPRGGKRMKAEILTVASPACLQTCGFCPISWLVFKGAVL